MRYIGSKANVLDFLEEKILSCVGDAKDTVFADLFAGTAIVSTRFKKLGFKIISNDYLAFSYSLQTAYIKNNSLPEFKKLKQGKYSEILCNLNELKPIKGFFYSNYCLNQQTTYQRNYFSVENAMKIDAILKKINQWKTCGDLSFIEESILRTSLIEAVSKVSNISGTYGAFLKHDDPRKNKKLFLEPIEIVESDSTHKCYNKNIDELINKIKGDILYLDPPYNQRQYPPYYHILETLSLDDNPEIYGKTGRRPYKDKLSPYCIKLQAKKAFEKLISAAQFKHIFVSYNTEGILSTDEFMCLLAAHGEAKMFRFNYRRFKSNSNGNNHHKKVEELLFYVRKN